MKFFVLFFIVTFFALALAIPLTTETTQAEQGIVGDLANGAFDTAQKVTDFATGTASKLLTTAEGVVQTVTGLKPGIPQITLNAGDTAKNAGKVVHNVVSAVTGGARRPIRGEIVTITGSENGGDTDEKPPNILQKAGHRTVHVLKGVVKHTVRLFDRAIKSICNIFRRPNSSNNEE